MKIDAELKGSNTEALEQLITITISQIKALTDANIGKTFEFTLSEHNKDNSQGCSIYPSQSERSDLVDNTVKNRILVIDVNYLPTECKSSSIEEERNRMEDIYKCKVLFIDTSRQNTQGMQVSHPPVFFI